MKYVLITGRGDGSKDETAKMEIMSADGTTVICQNPKNKYPENVIGAFSAVTNVMTIVACGGEDESESEISSCYSYGGDKKWNKLADMTTPRFYSSSVPIPGGVWVTGGYDRFNTVTGGYDRNNTLKTSEMIFLNKTKKVGKPLPAARAGHCLVNYGDKIFSTGGWDENVDVTSNVWQFDSGDNFVKTDGPEMKKKRYGHGCEIVLSIHHGSRPLLVVAGSNSGPEDIGDSEYWDFTVPGSTWQPCSKSCSFFSYYTRIPFL